MVSKKSLSIVLTLIFLLAAAIPTASAIGIDNIKNSKDIPAGESFNLNGKAIEHNPIWNDYAPIEIKNLFGLGKVLLQGAITQHDFICGTDCSSTMEIYLAEDSVLIDDVDFYTIKDDGSRVKQDVRSYQFYVNGEAYEIGAEMPSGIYEVRLEAEKKATRTVDWVIKTQGETLESWAVWGGGFIGDEYQLILHADSIDEGGLEINNVTVEQLRTNVWKINTTETDNNLSRAKIIQTLFDGTTGLDPRATSTYITNPTTVFSNDQRDDNMTGYLYRTTSDRDTYIVRGNFSSSDNNNVTMWFYSRCSTGGNGCGPITLRMPESTVIKSFPDTTSSRTTNYIGTTTSDSVLNPVNFSMSGGDNSVGTSSEERILILSKASINFSFDIATSLGSSTNSSTDFFADEGFPAFTFPYGQVTLNSPADNYISPTNEVEFNCSADVASGATLTNISLWTNETGSWGARETEQVIIDNFNDNVFDTSLWVNTSSSSDPGDGDVIESGTQIVASAVSHAFGQWGYGKFNSINSIFQKGNTTWIKFNNIQTTVNAPDDAYARVKIDSVSMINWQPSSPSILNVTDIKIEVFNDTEFKYAKKTSGSWGAWVNGSYTSGILYFETYIEDESGSTSPYMKIEIDFVNHFENSSNIETTFNQTITYPIDWTCSAGDSDGDTGFSIENRTLLLDTSPPIINITYPVASFDYTYVGQNLSLNWTVSDTNLESCWYNYNNTNTTVTCADLNASFILTDQKNITFYANDSVANEANFTRSWTNKIFANSQTYNSTTYETASEGFKLNLTSDGTQLVLADLVYDDTAYTSTKVGNNSEMEFNRNLIIPAIDIATAQNKSFYWNVTYGSEVIPTETNNQSVERIALGLCNSTLTVPYINFTFEDEETTVSTNATIDTSTWTYYLGDGSVNKTLLYSTTADNESYGFCFDPTDKTMDAVLELQYSGAGYPQRRWSTSGSLTNTTTIPTLYMLASADGTYSVYQVQDTVGNGIPGVEVQAERQFAGVWTLVEQGVTDSAGGFTGWLNPDYDHRITFTKPGYTTIQVTVRPSSSTYTVVMSSGESEAVYNSSEEGMTWVVYPNLGQILFPNTTQDFLFNITANYSNLVSCKMEVVNNDSVSLGITTGCDANGGNLSLSIPLGENKSVRAIYSINIGEGFFILDSDAYWALMVINIPERGTLTSFFVHLRDLNEFGSDNNRQEFSRIVFFYLILAIVMASISRATNWDLINIGGSLVFMNFIIIFGSYAGFLTLSYTGINGWMDQYVVALITSLFTAGFIFNKLEGRV